ncbi:hypothetical protein PO909_005628, partial [Leuciscus waleckii]
DVHVYFNVTLNGPCGKGDVVEQCALPDQTPAVVLRLTEALERLDWENEPLYRSGQTTIGPPELLQALETGQVHKWFILYMLISEYLH